MERNDAVYEIGLALLNQLHGGEAGAHMVEAMKDLCPDFTTRGVAQNGRSFLLRS